MAFVKVLNAIKAYILFVMSQKIVALSKIHGHGRVQLPVEIRQYLGLVDGDGLLFVQDANGRISVEKGGKIERHLGKYKA